MQRSVRTSLFRQSRIFYSMIENRLVSSLRDLTAPVSLSDQAVAAFLSIGFVPGDATLFEGICCLPGGVDAELSENGLSLKNAYRFSLDKEIQEASSAEKKSILTRRIRKAFESVCDERPPIVPLSGGLDSRTVLGFLLERYPAREIRTYTYGSRGMRDFELGSEVAKQLGTTHEAIDLSQVELRHDDLIEVALRSGANTDLFQPVVWLEVERRFGNDGTIWSGYAGDGVGGSFKRLDESSNINDAVIRFIEFESRLLHYCKCVESCKELVRTDTKFDTVLNPLEAIWFENHVERYTAHHIFMDGLSYVAPLMETDVVSGFTSLPVSMRSGKAFYNSVVVDLFPDLYEIPTSDYGYKFSRKGPRRFRDVSFWLKDRFRRANYRLYPKLGHPAISYRDYRHGIRHKEDIRRVVRNLVARAGELDMVDEARVWLLWKEHDQGRDRSPALTLIASLGAIAESIGA